MSTAATPIAKSKYDESRLAQILVAPIVSEKATRVGEKHNQVLFKVLRNATKPEIKAAVELRSLRCGSSTKRARPSASAARSAAATT